jgi:hypothetical protein
MTDPTHPGDLARWLEQATRGLPQPAAASVRAELAAHVEDAVDDYVQQGLPQSAAYQRALAELGDPRTAAHGFNDVYQGRRHYIAAMLASMLLPVLGFAFQLVYTMLDITDYSTPSRIFYVINHLLFASLLFYVVIVLRWLLTWRFDNRISGAPSNVVLGGLAAYLIGNLPLELAIDSWDPVPTLRTASSAAEWVGILFMHGGMLVIYIGVFWLGMRALPTRNGLVKSVAIIGCALSVDSTLALTLWYLDVPFAYLFSELSLVFGFFLWPMLSLLFFHAIYASRRLPTQTA